MHIDVRVTGGVVRGEVEADLAMFRGIPYATLTERFGAPCAVQGWDGVRQALSFGPPPPQSALLGLHGLDEQGEDCLTVNVWTTDLAGGLPVMVWIHGGAYLFGMSGLPEYDGSTLARGGVVVVTFDYRVGLEGFGYVEGTPANRGLLDQVAALQWVRENIAAFGGDPGAVTVFGQSAGGGGVAALLVMPRAAGLFRRAIAQSVPGTFFTPALAADIARTCAEELGTTPSQLPAAHPQRLPAAADAVMAKMHQFTDRWGLAAHARVLLSPVVDGDVLPCTPWQGLDGHVELMVGHTRHEQRLLTALTGSLGSVTEEQALEAATIFAPDAEQYREHFPDPEDLYDVVRSDWLFRMPSLHLAERQVNAGGRAHLYELTWPAPGMSGALGACHGLDVPLVFGNLTVGRPAVLIGPPTPEAAGLSQQMRSAWTAFAADGDPGWPPYDTGLMRIFDVEPAVAEYPEQVSRRIWRDPPGVLDLMEA